jgi:hypothetical protein
VHCGSACCSTLRGRDGATIRASSVMWVHHVANASPHREVRTHDHATLNKWFAMPAVSRRVTSVTVHIIARGAGTSPSAARIRARHVGRGRFAVGSL